MYTHSPFPRFLILLSSALLMLTGYLSAQGIGEDMNAAQKALSDKDFVTAQKLLTGVVDNYSDGAIVEYGAKFGTIYYYKALAELILAQKANEANDAKGTKKWGQLSIESAKTCYEKFTDAADTENKTKNVHHKLSLQCWANAAKLLGDHEVAIKMSKKFMAERGAQDKFTPSPGNFYANLAVSYYSLEKPNITEGNLYFSKALKEKRKLKTADGVVFDGFLAFSKATGRTKDEKSLVQFLEEHRGAIDLAPYKANKYTPLFLNMASGAIKDKMYNAAYVLYGLVPNTSDVIAGIKTKIAQLPNRKGILDGANTIEVSKLQADLAKIEAQVASGEPNEVSILMGMAYLSEQAKNKNAVFAIFEILEDRYSKSKHRENNLFNLINASSAVGSTNKTANYGQVFLTDFPKSDKLSTVRENMLVSLFFSGKYEQSLALADEAIDGLAAKGPSEAHDICLFVKGGSHFYLGQTKEAQPYLDKHVSSYPNSKLAVHSGYYQASNLTSSREWIKATRALNSFIEKHPDPAVNSYLPNALYDLANCYYSDSKYDESLTRINRLENEFPGAQVINLAYNLKGNIYESTDKHAEAEEYYVKALNTGESKAQRGVAAESLTYLVGLLSSETIGGKPNTRMSEALVYYDKFLAEHKDSSFKAQVVVFGLAAMKKAGRGQEALDNLKAVIVESAATDRQLYLEEAVNAFSESFLEIEGNTPLMLKDIYYGLPIDLENKRALALLRISVIGAYEKFLSSPEVAENKKLKLRYTADIKSLFDDLKRTFKPKDLTNFILVRIGDYLRIKTSEPKQSIPYYEELLTRKSNAGQKNKALLGIADVMGNSTDPADKKKAIATLEEVLKKEGGDKTAKGEALFRLAELYSEQSDWVNTEKNARQYLAEKHTKKSAEASYLFALSFDKRKMLEDALSNYGQLAVNNAGYLKVSAPAVKRVLEIMWNRNFPVGKVIGTGARKITLEKSDRQTAYEEIGSRYIARTAKIRKTNTKITDKEKQTWDAVAALVKKYENSGSVKTLEQIKADANRRTR